MAGMIKILLLSVMVLVSAGCATTYVPISWGVGERVQQLSRKDLTLSTLFDHYDPQRSTLRVGGQSFDEVMMPSQVKYHLGAYRPDTRMIYRNLYHEYNDRELRDLMVHEFAHHIWFSSMKQAQRDRWRAHLVSYPSPVQDMVRRVYPRSADHDTEDFAFTMEYPRRVDIEALAGLKLITEEERDAILEEMAKSDGGDLPPAHPYLSAAGLGQPESIKGSEPPK